MTGGGSESVWCGVLFFVVGGSRGGGDRGRGITD